MRPFILASQSPRRRKLLKQIGMKFRIVPSRAAEIVSPNQTPSDNAQRIALEKALEVARRVRRGIILGADTIVVLDHRVLGKPKSKEDAKRMLRSLSGREHSVFTGFALVDVKSGQHTTGVEETRVRFRKLEEEEIISYINSGSPMDKAGAYGIQDDFGAVFVERVNGCFYNVVGFPLARFYSTFQQFTADLNVDTKNRL